MGNKIYRQDNIWTGPLYQVAQLVAKKHQQAVTASLQYNLWRIGAFNGIKDRNGRPIAYSQAVDGINGRMTQAAMRKAKSLGYVIDESSGRIFRGGLPAILAHKKKYKVKHFKKKKNKRNEAIERRAHCSGEGKIVKDKCTTCHAR